MFVSTNTNLILGLLQSKYKKKHIVAKDVVGLLGATNARGVGRERRGNLRGGCMSILCVCVCVYSLTGCESLCHNGVSTHRPVLSPNLEASLNKIKVLPQ